MAFFGVASPLRCLCIYVCIKIAILLLVREPFHDMDYHSLDRVILHDLMMESPVPRVPQYG